MRSIRESATATGRRIRAFPGLFAVGVAGTVAAVGGVGVALSAGTLPQSSSPPPFEVARVFVSVLVAFEFVRGVTFGGALGVAAPTLRGEAGLFEALDVEAPARAYEHLVGAAVVRAVGVVVVVVAIVGLLGLYLPAVTLLQGVGYAAGVGSNEMTYWVGIGGLGLLASGTVFAVATVGTAGGRLAAGERYGPALRQSLLAPLETPMRALGHGVVVTFLAVLPAAVGGGGYLVAGPAAGLAALSLVGAGVYTALPVYRAVATERPEDRPEQTVDVRARLPSRSRIALVVAVLAVGLFGAATVRVTDARPMDTQPPGFDADRPGESFERALAAIERSSHTTVVEYYERSPPESDPVWDGRTVFEYDRADRKLSVYRVDRRHEDAPELKRWSVLANYLTEGATLQASDERSQRPSVTGVRANETVWERTHRIDHRTALARGVAHSDVEGIDPTWQPDAWRVDRLSNGTVRFATRGAKAFERATEWNGEFLRSGNARVFVDAETGYVTRIVVDYVREDTDEEGADTHVRLVATLEYGSTDVTRPPGAPAPGLREVAYDALLY